VSVTLQGGYDNIFDTIVSNTEYFGTLTITGGAVFVSDLIIKKVV